LQNSSCAATTQCAREHFSYFAATHPRSLEGTSALPTASLFCFCFCFHRCGFLWVFKIILRVPPRKKKLENTGVSNHNVAYGVHLHGLYVLWILRSWGWNRKFLRNVETIYNNRTAIPHKQWILKSYRTTIYNFPWFTTKCEGKTEMLQEALGAFWQHLR
jgi:hypothetical protein